MSLDDAARLHLYEFARRTWDEAAAATLMNAIPQDPDRLATKDGVAVLGADLRTEMADLRTDLRTEMADLRTDLRTEMADLRTDLRTEMADLRTEMADLRAEMRTGFADIRAEIADLRGETKQTASEMMRTLMFGMIASNATLVGLVFAAVKLA